MHHLKTWSTHLRRLFLAGGMTTALLLSLWVVVGAQSTPLSPFGYLNFSYTGYAGAGSPSGEKPESKLWWNDGFWWGSLFNSSTSKFHIYRLNWGAQTWEDTGVVLDDRNNTKADTLWDNTAKKLYVASHVAVESDGEEASLANSARLYRYSYDATAQKYSLDQGFPVNINKDRTETLVLAKAASGRFWITYISRGTTPKATPDYRVFVNSSADGVTWGTPFVPTLNVTNTGVHVGRGDIAAVVAFSNSVGIMWNNTISDSNHTLHFAYRAANDNSSNTPWTHQMISVPGGADDHVSLRSLHANPNGQVFAAIKTSTPLTDPLTQTIALIGLVARDVDGTISFHMYSRNTDKDTQPSLVIDEGDPANSGDDKAYIFATGKEGGSKICYKTLAIKSPLSSMGNFPVGDCGTDFIEDRTYRLINNATSMKQNANKTTGIVVLAADDLTVPTTTQVSRVYVHNVLGDPPPVVTAYGPKGPAPLTLSTVVTATFSKQINPTTLNSTSFILESAGGPVAGTVNYDANSRTATFVPSALLNANTVYTVKLTNAIKDNAGQGLNAGIDAGPVIEQWSFSTASTGVQFDSNSYTVNELDGTATITVMLDTPSAQVVTVKYATSNGTATAGSDYTATNGTVTFAAGETSKTFTVAITDDAMQEGAEALTLTLSEPAGASLGATPTATLTIIDDESTTVQLTTANLHIDENGGQAQIEVTLSKAAAFPVTVDYAITAGTATADADYSATNGTLTFAAGETSKSFAITIVDDTLFETSETINLALSNVTPGTASLGIPAASVVTIVDNDSLPTVAFSTATYNVNENGGNATITAQLSAASSQQVTVQYATSDGTASAGSDYTTASGTLTFAPGETTKSFTIAVANDALDEEDEVVELALNAPTNANLGAVAGAVLTIADDDAAPTVQFESASATAKENVSLVEIVVTLSAPSGKLVTVKYASSNGTATEGSDYAAAIGTLTFAPGETSKRIELSLLNDKNGENNETLSLALSAPTNATAGATVTFTLTIQDDDTTTPVAKHLYLPLVRK